MTSDWDVLLVVPGPARQRRREGQIDIISVSIFDLESKWPRMDLASHVAHYGIQLSGDSVLPLNVSPVFAAVRKSKIVAARTARLDQLWSLFDRCSRLSEGLRLRRDIQRARRLGMGLPVPATAVLDDEWRDLSNDGRREAVTAAAPSRRIERALLHGCWGASA
ncbi:MAG: hypothetical protein Q8L14_30675 [Myxococcales bacterium]|nr:hypothetical protein [Myxococcales bacterium]